MAYDEKLADRVREYLFNECDETITEKRMFSGLAFLVNDKMCINISGDRLMCRFDSARTEELLELPEVEPMVMHGKALQGYCLVNPEGYAKQADFLFWMGVCLEFNPLAQKSQKRNAKVQYP